MPETIHHTQLAQATIAVFRDLLGRLPKSPIDYECLHRALRPKGRDTDPPRDIVCCLVNFKLKEEILHRSRDRHNLMYQGTDIKKFQDLSPITLQNRRDLRPLLDLLCANGIQYYWKLPFCLMASAQGITVFCEVLNIPRSELPDWYRTLRPPHLRRSTSTDAIPVWDDFHS